MRDRSGMGCGLRGRLSLNVSSAFLCVFVGLQPQGVAYGVFWSLHVFNIG